MTVMYVRQLLLGVAAAIAFKAGMVHADTGLHEGIWAAVDEERARPAGLQVPTKGNGHGELGLGVRRLQTSEEDIEWLEARIEDGRGDFWPVRPDCLETTFKNHKIKKEKLSSDHETAKARLLIRVIPSGVDERHKELGGDVQMRVKIYKVIQRPSSVRLVDGEFVYADDPDEATDDGEYQDIGFEPEFHTLTEAENWKTKFWVGDLELGAEYAYQFFTECDCEGGTDACARHGEDSYVRRVGVFNKGIHFFALDN